MAAISIAAGATPTAVIAGGNYDFVHIRNESGVTMYLSYDGDLTALTVANGMPLKTGEFIMINNDSSRQTFRKPIMAVHGDAGAQELRVQGS